MDKKHALILKALRQYKNMLQSEGVEHYHRDGEIPPGLLTELTELNELIRVKEDA